MPITASAANQFAADHRDRGQQELLPLLVRFAEDGIPVVESVEELRELENMFGQIRGLGRGDALVDHVGGLGGRQPELPDFVGGFAG